MHNGTDNTANSLETIIKNIQNSNISKLPGKIKTSKKLEKTLFSDIPEYFFGIVIDTVSELMYNNVTNIVSE